MTSDTPVFQVSEKAILLENESLAPLTSFCIGGPAQWLLMPAETEDIRAAIFFCKRNNLPLHILGSGTNLLVPDAGLKGVVIKFWKNFNHYQVDGQRITAQSGLDMLGFSQIAAENSLKGIEWCCGLPGTVGGAICMNAGIKDLQIQDVFLGANVLDPQGNITKWSKEKLAFSYRSSAIQNSGTIILNAEFLLKPGNKDDIYQLMNEHLNKRKVSQPLDLPNCGSVFRNPEGTFAGKLIQESGLKGYNVGGVMVSEQHANFIVNTGSGKASDVIELIATIKEQVKAKFQVDLELELKILV